LLHILSPVSEELYPRNLGLGKSSKIRGLFPSRLERFEEMTTEIVTGGDCFVAPLLAMTGLLVIASVAKQSHRATIP
jgi:hypothetical protein